MPGQNRSVTRGYRLEIVAHWWVRTSGWAKEQILSPVQTSKIGLSELITVTGFLFSFIVMGFGWIGISEQTRVARAEQEIRDLQSRIADDQKVLADGAAAMKEKQRESKDIVLISPASNAYVIGDHVDLAWTYPGHSDRITYIVELIGARNGYRYRFGEAHEKPDLCGGGPAACHQVATDPAGQRTQIRNLGGGPFLWRVVAVRKDSVPDSWSEEKNAVSEWSDYGAFTIYKDAFKRMTTEEEGVRVGALVSQANGFVRYAEGGRIDGFDVELLNYVLKNCLKNIGKRLDFDKVSCAAGKQVSEPLKITPIPITDISDGFARLRDREIDIFVGSLTRLKRREQGGVRFTSGYYRVTSNIYVPVHASHNGETVAEWAMAPKTLGVIRDSSNHQLASLLMADPTLKNRLSLVTFGSWAELESALESGQVQGVLIDDVAAAEKLGAEKGQPEWRQLQGLQKIDATSLYYKSDEYLASGKEEFAFAVAPESETGNLLESLEQALTATGDLQTQLVAKYRDKGLKPQPRLGWFRRLIE